jgi:hypothetical protein
MRSASRPPLSAPTRTRAPNDPLSLELIVLDSKYCLPIASPRVERVADDAASGELGLRVRHHKLPVR